MLSNIILYVTDSHDGWIPDSDEFKQAGAGARNHGARTEHRGCECRITVQYSTVQYSTEQYSTAQYSTVQYSTVTTQRGQNTEALSAE